MELNTTTIEQILEYQKGQFVRLPDFSEGMPFYVRLRRPSLLNLVKTGRIPNTLVATANRLFNGKGMDDTNLEAMPEILGVLEVICEVSLVEPKYKEMKDAGIELTDQQMLAIFNYTQEGVKALEPFCEQPRNNPDNSDVPDVQSSAIGTDAY